MAAVEASGAYEGHAEFTAPESDSKGKLVSNCRTLRTLGWRPKYGETGGCCGCRISCACSSHSVWLLPLPVLRRNVQLNSVHACLGRAPGSSCQAISQASYRRPPDALLVFCRRELRGVHGSGRQGLVQRGAGSRHAGQCARLRHQARASDVQGSVDRRGMAVERGRGC